MYTNKTGIPLNLAVWLCHDTYDHIDSKNYISATGLLKPLKAIELQKRHKDQLAQLDLADLISSRLGTAVHEAAETPWKDPIKVKEHLVNNLGSNELIAETVVINPSPESIKPEQTPIYLEKRTIKDIEIDGTTYHIGGKFDFVQNGVLRDLKTTSVWTYVFNSTEDYKKQGSIYRWLNPDIITSEDFYIDFLFTDYKKTNQYGSDYPPSRILSKKIPLYSLEDTEAFIKERIRSLIEISKQTSQLTMKDCTSEELWQRDPVWKYYKDPSKTNRSTKNFDNSNDALQRQQSDNNVGIVSKVDGEVVRCRYCSVSNVCLQAANLREQNLLRD